MYVLKYSLDYIDLLKRSSVDYAHFHSADVITLVNDITCVIYAHNNLTIDLYCYAPNDYAPNESMLDIENITYKQALQIVYIFSLILGESKNE